MRTSYGSSFTMLHERLQPAPLVHLGNADVVAICMARRSPNTYAYYFCESLGHVCVHISPAPSGFNFRPVYEDRALSFQPPEGNYPTLADYLPVLLDEYVLWRLAQDAD